jgi:hypothetical protein
MFVVRLWTTTSPYRWLVGNLPSTCMLCTSHPPHYTKDVYTPEGSTHGDLWTVGVQALKKIRRVIVFLFGHMLCLGNGNKRSNVVV